MSVSDRLIVALDLSGRDAALWMVDALMPEVSQFKVGLELFYAGGIEVIRDIHRAGARVFLDLKLHDIPNTVAGAARSLRQAGVWMTNVHASGGPAMMRAAREALPDTLLLAVTVLTSLDQETVEPLWGTRRSIDDTVSLWAREAQSQGLDGIVCSPREIRMVREAVGPGFLLVTPGIRPAGTALNDQRRVTTVGQALESGADYLVIGRPITGSDDPAGAARKVIAEMREGVAGDEPQA